MAKKLTTLILSSIFINNIYADDQFIFDNVLTNQNNYNSSTAANIDVNRTFATFTDALTKLKSLGFTCNVTANNAQDPLNQVIKYSGSSVGLVNIIAQKFNYTATINGNAVIFTPMYPAPPKKVESQVALSNLSSNQVTSSIKPLSVSQPIVSSDNWDYSIQDKYISTTLNRWAKQANYQLIWQSDNDFEVQSNGVLKGVSFKAAVNEILKSLKHSEHPLKAEWYKNNVVVISNFGG